MDFEPDPTEMQAFLDHLFGEATDGKIELAWTDAEHHKLKHARLFDVDQLEELIEDAVRENKVEGQNVYVGAALRKADKPPFGRCNDQDFLEAPAFWVDLDDGDAVIGARKKYNGTPPTLAVITGEKPHPRAQLWWRRETPCRDATQLQEQNAILASALGGDPSVTNPSRVMRLAGSIAWPTKPGRVIELVKLVAFNDTRPRQYVEGQIERAFSRSDNIAETSKKRCGLDLDTVIDPIKMLRSAMPGSWHNAMRDFTAHCVSHGYPDWIIIEAARQVLDDPADPGDVSKLIEGARKKFGIADPSQQQTESTPLKFIGLGSLIRMDIPERKTLFGPWLPGQGLVMAFSETGMGKTFFALNVAHAVATGGSYLNWQATERRKVIYLDGEMPSRTMQDRSRAIAGFEPPDDLDDWFSVLTPDFQDAAMPDLATKEGQQKLEPYLHGVGLVVIDHLSALCRSGIENEAESWLPLQSWLLDLRRCGLSVLLIHHAGKGGAQRGTSRREDVLDTVIKLQRPKDYEPEDGARFEIHFTKHRGFMGENAAPIEATLTTDSLGRAKWEVVKLGDRLTEEIADLAEQGMSEREIARQLGVSKSMVHRKKVLQP